MANTTNITDGATEVAFLENKVAKLDNESFLAFRNWFFEFEQQRWDQRLEEDSTNGKLDFLINAAIQEHLAGKTRDL
ncbi:hypothetical protein [Crenothrix sp.]|uniref:hypothetical protein n=1 Tax=Crenothrix sp. TaxID=3100433 RepID=UPI00374DCB85